MRCERAGGGAAGQADQVGHTQDPFAIPVHDADGQTDRLVEQRVAQLHEPTDTCTTTTGGRHGLHVMGTAGPTGRAR
jgi:hypothetical protein